MIKIIAKKSIKLDWYYEYVFENVPKKSIVDLGLLLEIIRHRMLDEVENGILPESRSDWIDVYIGKPEQGDDYYIAFYDASLDFFYKDRYGVEGIVYDEDRMMLKFSKLNFQHVLASWDNISVSQPEYIIITQGTDNWIDLLGKNKLTADELCLIDKYKHQQEELRAAELKRINARNQNTH